MARIYADRVKETTTTTGTGTINLAGAETGFQTFVAGIGTTNTCFYAIEDADATGWEVGIGTVTDAAPDTLSRTTIIDSSAAGAAITLTTGTHTVFCTSPAAFNNSFAIESAPGTPASAVGTDAIAIGDGAVSGDAAGDRSSANLCPARARPPGKRGLGDPAAADLDPGQADRGWQRRIRGTQ